MNSLKNVRSYAIKVGRTIGYAAYFASTMHCIMEYIGDFVVCGGPSMEPTIISGNIVICEHLSVHLNNYDKGKHSVSRGDIVISKNPFSPEHYICKRVKAIAGDGCLSEVRHGFFSEIEVPKGHVWLEGDNKDCSADSRSYGPVPEGLIRGRVVFIVWPFASMRKLTGYMENRA